MADRQFLRLSERWALAYDSLQWIIQRREGAKEGRENWRGVSFISSNRDILILTLKEKEAVIDPAKMGEVLALPFTFKEWIARRQNRGATGHRPGGLEIAAKKPPGGEMTYHTARSRVFPGSDASRVSAPPISAFSKKLLAAIPRELIDATLLDHAYEPEGGEDLLGIPPFLDRKAEVPLNHSIRMCRKAKARAA